MPFKSKKQQRFMFAAEARGELPKGTAKRWAHHTKSIKSLPEKVSKKEAGAMASIGRNVVAPAALHSSKALQWLLKRIPGGYGKGMAKGVGSYAKGLGKSIASKAAPDIERMGRYGVGGAAAVGIPALSTLLGIVSKSRRRKAEEAMRAEMARTGEEKVAHVGTPFMDGFLIRCAEVGLNEKQTIDAIEKAAQFKGRVGTEAKGFLERLAKCDE